MTAEATAWVAQRLFGWQAMSRLAADGVAAGMAAARAVAPGGASWGGPHPEGGTEHAALRDSTVVHARRRPGCSDETTTLTLRAVARFVDRALTGAERERFTELLDEYTLVLHKQANGSARSLTAIQADLRALTAAVHTRTAGAVS